MKNLNTIFKAYSNMTESDKKMMTNMIKEFVNAVKEIIIETAKEQNIKK
jgi:peroxiredoxin family protein